MFTRKSLVPALLLGTALTVTACGGSPSAPTVASLGTPTTSTAAAAPSSGKGFQQALAFSACMRSHGVPKFPDPQQNGNGISLRIGKGTGIDPGSPTFQNAQKACQSLMPGGGIKGGTGHVDLSKVSAWMRCLRGHGLPNLPDPVNKGGAMEFDLPGGQAGQNLDPQSSVFQQALKACQPQSPGGGLMVNRGGGSK